MEPRALDRIDEAIVGILSKCDKQMTVYKIAKEAKLSWATVNTHCYKLKADAVLEEKVYELGNGQKKSFWTVAARTPTLDKFS